MSVIKPLALSALLAATLSATAAPVEPDSVGGSGALRLAELTVTAIKGTPSLRPDAAASTTIGRAEAERLGVDGLRGVSELAPNFFMPQYGSRMTSSVYVRGLGARIDQPVVGMNIDNVGYLNKDAYDFDLADIESITVMRGPQSTLYGRNSMAGVVNITTLSPLRWQGVRATARVATRNSYYLSAGIYGLLAPQLGMALTVNGNYAGGYWRNEYNGDAVGREQGVAARWKTAWRPRAGLAIENTASLTYSRQDGFPYAYEPTGVIAYNDTCAYRRTAFADGLTINWHPSDHYSVASITSFQWLDDRLNLDQDFLPLDYFTLEQSRRERAVTQDIVARGRKGRYSWLGGLYGFVKHTNMLAPVVFYDTGLSELIEGKRNELNPSYPIVWDERRFPLNSRFRNPAQGAAIYHRSSLEAGLFTFSVDLRLDYEHTALRYHNDCRATYTVLDRYSNPQQPVVYDNKPVDIDMRGDLSQNFLQLLPKVTASMRLKGLGPDSRVWLSWSKGYKAGGFNTQMFSDVLQQQVMQEMGLTAKYDVDDIVSYRPEYSWNYEAGLTLHPAAMAGRLSLELCAFYIDCHDQQLTIYPDGVTTGRIMANAGRTRSWGFEAQFRYTPIESLTASLAWGFNDARFVEFANGMNDYSGKRVPYAPANTLFTSLLWHPADILGGHLQAGLNLQGAGHIYWDEANTSRQPFYALLGATATWTERLWSLELWGRNLTATRYATFRCVTIGHAFLQRGAPIQAGLTFRLTLAR